MKKLVPFIVLSLSIIFFSCVTESALINRKITQRADTITAKHIVFIGFDGLGAIFVPRANMPVLKQMIREGASSMRVYNVLPSMSWSNWPSVFSGAPPGLHSEDNFPVIFDVTKNSLSADNSDNIINAVFLYKW